MYSVAAPIREYMSLLDLAKNEDELLGIDDFYGRPVHGRKVTPETIVDAIHPDDLQSLLVALERLSDLRMGDVMNYQLRFRHADGRIIRSSYSFSPEQVNRDGRATVVRTSVQWFDE